MAEPAPSFMAAARPFAGRTGAGIRVAVIDSGVHPGHPHIDAGRIAPGVMILPNGAIVAEPGATLDRLGHGTAVTAALQEKAPGATCIPVRVFRDSLKASAIALVAAIRWAIENGAGIVNLSLGSVNPAHQTAFGAVARQAREAGVLLVAARE
ncbi:MAG: S8 family serine peptidase, partial [Sphingobium sp.]